MGRHSLLRGLALPVMLSLIGSSAAATAGQDFALQVGPPVAGSSQQTKKAMLVVRSGGCADPAKARITATAEGLVKGVRRSLPLTLEPLRTPGVHSLPREWSNGGGVWIVSLVGTCAGKTAGAIVALGPTDTYRRESVRLLGHRATAEEIDASLKALATGGSK